MADIQKIEYRKVTPEEKLYVERVQGSAFSFDVNEKEIREKIEKGEYNSDETYGAIDENGKALAGMEALTYTMWFDGHKVPMYGIGGVASLPETRRQGHIRKIFEKVFEDIHEKGAVFSHLYPFSHDYYRKFGYEPCGYVKRYILPLAPARKLKSEGSAHEFDKNGEAREKLIGVYESYASRHNNMLSRSEKRWNDYFDVSPFKTEKIYYWKNSGGDIKSWVKFKRNGDTIDVYDIAWENHEGMLGILQFLGIFEGAAGKIKLSASPEFIPELYWNNLYDIHIETDWIGMNRVVDVKRAFELMKKPNGDGRFTVKVNDGFAKWNDNTYIIEYGGGECSVKTTGQEADIELTVHALMQAVLGVYEFEQVAKREDVRVNDNLDILKKAFCKKPILITDHF